MTFAETMTQVRQLVRKHIKVLCEEILEWHSTAILRDGKFRELAKIVETVDEHCAYSILENVVHEEAMKFVVEKCDE